MKMIAGRTLFVCGLAREAALARGRGVETILSGGDVGRLTGALGRLDPRGFGRVISFGLAGGLDPALKAGDLVIASAVIDASERCEADAGLIAALRAVDPRAAGGVIANVEAPLASVAGKAACRQRCGAVAVDMESLAAARFAARHGLPFAMLRAISDPAETTLPPLAQVALRPDGGLAFGAIIRSLLAQPAQIAELPALARGSGRAFATLARIRRLAAPTLDLG